MAMGLEEITLHSSSLKYFFSFFQKNWREVDFLQSFMISFFFLKFVFSLLYFF